MKNKRSLLFVIIMLLVVLFAFGNDANAQQATSECTYCLPLAVPDFETLKSQKELFADYLSIIDKSNYSQARTMIGLDAVIPVEGIPIDFGGTYEQFDEQRGAYYRKIGYTRKEKETIEKLKVSLNPDIAKQYNECVRLCTQREGYIRWQLEGSKGKIFFIKFKLLPERNTPRLLRVKDLFITGGKIPRGQSFKNRYAIRPLYEFVIPFERTKGDFQLTFNAGPYPVSIYLPKPDPGPKYEWVKEKIGDCTDKDRTFGRKGISEPHSSECNANTVGQIAVCWDGDLHKHPQAPICAFKYVAPGECTGGGSRGQMYTCKQLGRLSQ